MPPILKGIMNGKWRFASSALSVKGEELTAEEIEFWQADKDRRHARLRFTRAGSGWSTQRLWP